MAKLRKRSPYIWVTSLSKLLAGENSCEWSSWFRAQRESNSWARVPSTFDSVAWQMDHAELLRKVSKRWGDQGHRVFLEYQNSLQLSGKVATLGGRPDLVALKDGLNTVIDVKTGQPKESDKIQVMLYMWAVPLAFPQYRSLVFDGIVVYRDHEIGIPAAAVDDHFISRVVALIRRLASPTPAARVPSYWECRFCSITLVDCPERVDSSLEETTTAVF